MLGHSHAAYVSTGSGVAIDSPVPKAAATASYIGDTDRPHTIGAIQTACVADISDIKRFLFTCREKE
jgi:hypothetical protein